MTTKDFKLKDCLIVMFGLTSFTGAVIYQERDLLIDYLKKELQPVVKKEVELRTKQKLKQTLPFLTDMEINDLYRLTADRNQTAVKRKLINITKREIKDEAKNKLKELF